MHTHLPFNTSTMFILFWYKCMEILLSEQMCSMSHEVSFICIIETVISYSFNEQIVNNVISRHAIRNSTYLLRYQQNVTSWRLPFSPHSGNYVPTNRTVQITWLLTQIPVLMCSHCSVQRKETQKYFSLTKSYSLWAAYENLFFFYI
jgi:hypothetical protein